MTTCAACGAPARERGRFCPSCGAPIGLDESGLLGSDAGGSVGGELPPGPGETPVVTTVGSVHRDAPIRRWLVGAVTLAALAVLGIWGAARLGDRSPAAPDVAEAATTTSTTSTTSSPTVDDTIVEGTAVGDTVPQENGPKEKVLVEGDGPVLGHPIGWSILFGDGYDEGMDLTRLDLDTGRLVRYLGIEGGPLVVLGNRVVLGAGMSSFGGSARLWSLPVDDLTAAVTPLDLPADTYADLVVPAEAGTGGDVWIYGQGDEPRWSLVRLADGAVVFDVPAPGLIDGLPVFGGGPEVVTSGSGGVFRRVGGGYRPVAPGRPMLVRGGHVLVRTCSSPTACELGWIDRDSGQPVDGAVPEDGNDQLWWQGLVSGSDRFLYGFRFSDPERGPDLVLFDLERGRLIEQEGDDFFFGAMAASPDGRYLAVGRGQGLIIYDAAAQTWQTMERALVAVSQLVFIPNG